MYVQMYMHGKSEVLPFLSLDYDSWELPFLTVNLGSDCVILLLLCGWRRLGGRVESSRSLSRLFVAHDSLAEYTDDDT